MPKKNAGFSKPRRARSDIFPVGRQNTNVCLKGEGIDLVRFKDVLLGGKVLEVLGDIQPPDSLAPERDDVIDVVAFRAARNKRKEGSLVAPFGGREFDPLLL